MPGDAIRGQPTQATVRRDGGDPSLRRWRSSAQALARDDPELPEGQFPIFGGRRYSVA